MQNEEQLTCTEKKEEEKEKDQNKWQWRVPREYKTRKFVRSSLTTRSLSSGISYVKNTRNGDDFDYLLVKHGMDCNKVYAFRSKSEENVGAKHDITQQQPKNDEN